MCPCVRASVRLCICVYLSLCVCVSLCPCVCASVRLCVCASVCLCVSVSVLREFFAGRSQNWIVTTQEQGLQRIKSAGPNGGGWHVDDLIQFPLPDHVPAHSPDAAPPTFVLQIFVLLTDVESVENGCAFRRGRVG